MTLQFRTRCAVLCGAPFAATLAGAQSQTWLQQLGSTTWDAVYGITADGTGGLFVSGTTFGNFAGPNAGTDDAWLARRGSDGEPLWALQLGTAGADLARGIAPDRSGGVYVSGVTGGALGGAHAGQSDAWLARYSASGQEVWIRQLGTAGEDWAESTAPDGVGGVFVTGYTSGSLGGPTAGQNDIWLARYDHTGTALWMRQLGSTASEWSEAITPDGTGGVYLCGVTYGSLGALNAGQNDAWIARYGSAGNVIWIRQLGTPAADLARGAAPDGAGGVFVCGVTYGDLGGPTAGSDDAWLARYDGAGNRLWLRQLGTSAGDFAYDAASDGLGGVYIGGYTNGSFGGANSGSADAWLAHFDGAGVRTWIQQLGTSELDLAVALAPDGSGGVFIGGETGGALGGPNAGASDAWLARHEVGLAYTRYCTPAEPNSSGASGRIAAAGENLAAADDLTLVATRLPLHSFGYFLVSRDQGSVPGAGGGQGVLCLGGAIGRFNGAGQVMSSGGTGSFALDVPVSALPQPTGSVPAQPGETWRFQAWHRDANPTSTSNLTDALNVTFE